MLHKDLM